MVLCKIVCLCVYVDLDGLSLAGARVHRAVAATSSNSCRGGSVQLRVFPLLLEGFDLGFELDVCQSFANQL